MNRQIADCHCAQCQADRLYTLKGMAKAVLGAVVLLALFGGMGALFAMAMAS
jgi:hypothetical protein